MTGPKGNSEFCFPETLNVTRGEAEGNIEARGNKTHCLLKHATKDRLVTRDK